jgi:hypothetical protein
MCWSQVQGQDGVFHLKEPGGAWESPIHVWQKQVSKKETRNRHRSKKRARSQEPQREQGK